MKFKKINKTFGRKLGVHKEQTIKQAHTPLQFEQHPRLKG